MKGHFFSKSRVSLASVLGMVSILFVFGGCGRSFPESLSELEPHPQNQANLANIRFSDDMSSDKKQKINKDLEVLRMLWVSSPNLQTIMKTSDTSPVQLVNWLQDRVKIIVSKDFDYQHNARFAKVGESTSTVVMSNLSAELYLLAVESNKVVRLRIPGLGGAFDVKLSSGVIQEGPGFFKDLIGVGSQDDVPHTVFRLATLFHEAQHSRGRGKSRAFQHSNCPSDHDYAGKAACDKNLNGPYSVGAYFIKGIKDACKKCKKSTLDTLNILAADSFSRILYDENISEWDDTPES